MKDKDMSFEDMETLRELVKQLILVEGQVTTPQASHNVKLVMIHMCTKLCHLDVEDTQTVVDEVVSDLIIQEAAAQRGLTLPMPDTIQ